MTNTGVLSASDTVEGLVVHASVGAWLVAIVASGVERVALADDIGVELQPLEPSATPPPNGALGVVTIDGRRFAAWDLGRMLGVASTDGAWVFARLESRDGSRARVALRTSGCRSVTRLDASDTSPLPPGMFVRSRRPFDSAFVPSSHQEGRRTKSAGGLVLDLAALFDARELAFTRELLERRRGP